MEHKYDCGFSIKYSNNNDIRFIEYNNIDEVIKYYYNYKPFYINNHIEEIDDLS